MLQIGFGKVIQNHVKWSSGYSCCLCNTQVIINCYYMVHDVSTPRSGFFFLSSQLLSNVGFTICWQTGV